MKSLTTTLTMSIALASMCAQAWADPCGMVPPVSLDGAPIPIRRVGLQKTYMFFADGIETIVLRPGFSGDVDNFGMLIPFPSPPGIRKVPDNVFAQIAAAVDPPEIRVDLRPRPKMRRNIMARASAPRKKAEEKPLEYDEVRVLKQEAVGMYEVAVLEAGSAAALKAWMDQNGFRYPEGMDGPANEYVEDGWCFVAVKTRVGSKKGVEPQPGMRKARPALPAGATFSGHVQAMGFRFKVDKPVIPMRLSTFNDGDLHNVVYTLTRRPQRVRSISVDKVVRQITGRELFRNVTEPLPLRILGGNARDVARHPSWPQNLKTRRDPTPHNGVAKELFASDLLAARTKALSHPHEEREKTYLDIGERLGLRGPNNDQAIQAALKSEREEILIGALRGLRRMTMSIVDGDFPRELLRDQNLELVTYRMAERRNNQRGYNAVQFGPGREANGLRWEGRLPRR